MPEMITAGEEIWYGRFFGGGATGLEGASVDGAKTDGAKWWGLPDLNWGPADYE